MATQNRTQTRTQRQAAGKKAAATRRRNAAKSSAATTRRSARSTRSEARNTARAARNTTRAAERTTRSATRTAGRRLDAAAARLDAVGRQAERVLLIQVGAVAEVRDTVSKTARKYTSATKANRELKRLERRGERVLGRTQRAAKARRREVEHDVRSTSRNVERQANGFVSDAKDLAGRISGLA